MAIGCGVSIVVGLLFWPRGAMAALGRALADAFVASSGYLADVVDRLTSTSRQVDTMPGQRASHSAYLRLDDAFRQFLIERGAKVIPVEDVTKLFTGSNRIRLAAYTLDALPRLPVDSGQSEARIGVGRRGGPARFVRLEPPLVRGVRRTALRPPRLARPAPAARRDRATARCARRSTTPGWGAGATACAASCRCCGRTSSSRPSDRCRRTWPTRPISSPGDGPRS